jgi:spore maturation protein CgeB
MYGQIKGRDMELMGCGAFMLASEHVECTDFHEMYTPDKEFAEYHLVDEMVEGVKYWLENDTSRHAVAMNAYHKRDTNLWTARLKKFLEDWGTW